MKPGAIVLYIDNAGGGFDKLVSEEAENCCLKSEFYLNHETFIESALNVKKFGYVPCFESTVSVHIWKKTFPKNKSLAQPSYSYDKKDFPSFSTIVTLPPREYRDKLHNKTSLCNNKVPVSRTFASLFSKSTIADQTTLFQEIEYANYSTNDLFDSCERNTETLRNSLKKLSEPLKTTYLREIHAGDQAQCGIAGDAVDSKCIDSGGELSNTKNGASMAVDSYVNKARSSRNSQNEPSERPKEVTGDELVHSKIAKNTVSKYSSDLNKNQPRLKLGKNPTIVLNVNTRNESSKKQTNTNWKNVTADKALPNRITSRLLRWVDCIRDLFCLEVIGLITGEFNACLFEEQLIIPSIEAVGERFLFYLYETA